MNEPTFTTDDLIDLLTQHQVIEAESLWQFLASRGGANGLPEDPQEVALDLVRERLLSDYQAERLLEGDIDGLVVGRYHLIGQVGDLTSSVFVAVRRPGTQRFALKLLSRDGEMPAPTVARFQREAEALARLDHPGIVAIKDSGEDNGRLFLVTEFVDGESLAEIVQRQGPMAPAPAARIIEQVLGALEHIHNSGLVHRNLEPGHILVDREHRVRIIDLGLARFLDDPGANLTVLKGASQLLGAVEYQSPEQLLDSHDVDSRTDIYALGAIFYFLLTGRAPFSQHALLRLAAGVETHPQPLAQLRPDIPRELVAIVEKMMARDPSARFASPTDVLAKVQPWLNEVSPPPIQIVRRPSPSAQGVRPPSKQAIESGLEPEPQPVVIPATPLVPNWVLALLLFLMTLATALVVMALRRGS